MNVEEWLDLVAYKTKNDMSIVYLSKFDNSYITMLGQENNVSFLAEKEITEQLTHGVGYSPKDNKWYGWSRRAIFGFNIGSTCKKGDSHYMPATPEELIDGYAEFYSDISEELVNEKRKECQILPDRSGIRVLPAPLMIPVANSIEELTNFIVDEVNLEEEDIFKDKFYEIKCGKGEWTAKTMEDAKQMAIDFNEGVS